MVVRIQYTAVISSGLRSDDEPKTTKNRPFMANNGPPKAILGPFTTKFYVQLAPDFILVAALAPRASTRNKNKIYEQSSCSGGRVFVRRVDIRAVFGQCRDD
jgi:hypothetical protein